MVTRLLLLGLLAGALTAACDEAPAAPGEPGAPSLARLQPPAPAVGETVTLIGSGFASTGNTVRIGAGYLGNLAASDGSTLRFSLPAYLSPCPPEVQVCIQVVVEVKPGPYPVSVTNANGTSNAVTMQVAAR